MTPQQPPQQRSTFKTKPCALVLSSGKCMKKGCTFAHTTEEFKPIKCRDDTLCVYSKTTCNFIHTGETKENYLTRMKIVFPKIENEKYKMCRHQLFFGNCKNENCTFAHSFAEIVITKCKNGNDCCFFSDHKCDFIHPCETMESFYLRKIKIHTSISVKTKPEKDVDDNTDNKKVGEIKPIIIHFGEDEEDGDDEEDEN